MANFPTSVFSPASRSNGQTIDQSWFNGLQDEVTAIEDGFRNATAPLNSSKSTVASLSVTGGTTLATLNVTGGSTFGSITLGASTLTSLNVTTGSTHAKLSVTGGSTLATLNVTGGSTLQALKAGASTLTSLSVTGNSTFANRPTMPLPDVAILGIAAPQALSNSGTTSALVWTAQNLLVNSSMHSTTTAPSHISPQSTGVYALSVNIALSASLHESTSELNVQLQDSSGTILGIGQLIGDSFDDAAVSASALKRFDALGGWVRAVAYVRDGSTASVRTGITAFFLNKLL